MGTAVSDFSRQSTMPSAQRQGCGHVDRAPHSIGAFSVRPGRDGGESNLQVLKIWYPFPFHSSIEREEGRELFKSSYVTGATRSGLCPGVNRICTLELKVLVVGKKCQWKREKEK